MSLGVLSLQALLQGAQGKCTPSGKNEGVSGDAKNGLAQKQGVREPGGPGSDSPGVRSARLGVPEEWGGRRAVRRVDTLGLAQVPARFRANFPGRVSCLQPSAFTGPGGNGSRRPP